MITLYERLNTPEVKTALTGGMKASKIAARFPSLVFAASESHIRAAIKRLRSELSITEPPNVSQKTSNSQMFTDEVLPVINVVGAGKLAQMASTGKQPLPVSFGASVEVVTAPPPPDFAAQGKAEYERMKALSTAYLDKRIASPPDFVEYRIQSDGPILLTHLSDLHIGGEGTNHDLAERHAQLIADTPGCFALFGGDGIDNFIKHQSALVNKTGNPAQEYAALGYWLSLFPFLGEPGKSPCKLLGGISGNHELWTKGFAGIDFLKQLFAERGLVYTPSRLRVVLHVNQQVYKIELRHNYRFKSSINLGNQFHRMWEMSDWEWDIGMIGHTHDGPYIEPFTRHSKVRYASLAGAYKQVDSYSEQYGFNAAQPASPSFILGHDSHSITGIADITQAVKALTALRR